MMTSAELINAAVCCSTVSTPGLLPQIDVIQAMPTITTLLSSGLTQSASFSVVGHGYSRGSMPTAQGFELRRLSLRP